MTSGSRRLRRAVRSAPGPALSAAALGLTVLGILAPLGGFGLIFGPGGGDQNTFWGGLGFTLILIGAPVGCVGYGWSVVIAIISARRG